MNLVALTPILLAVALDSPLRAQEPVTGGAVEYLALPPASIRTNDLESNSRIVLFREQADALVPSSIGVDITGQNLPGFYHRFGTNDLHPGQIPAGSRVDSYLLHQDTIGTHAMSGTIVFPRDVVAIIVRSQTLFSTDGLGAQVTGTVYPQGSNGDRGLERHNATYDAVMLLPDRRTMEIHLRTADDANNLDEIRVLTLSADSPVRAYCFGGVDCPCLLAGSDPMSGCRNSTGAGAVLTWDGSTSVSAPEEVSMSLVDLPSQSFGLLFVGVSETRAPFGEGLRCVAPGPPGPASAPWAFGLVRLPMQSTGDSGSISYPMIRSELVGRGVPLVPGQRLYFQGYYRDAGLSSCASIKVLEGFNFTNALEVTLQP